MLAHFVIINSGGGGSKKVQYALVFNFCVNVYIRKINQEQKKWSIKHETFLNATLQLAQATCNANLNEIRF